MIVFEFMQILHMRAVQYQTYKFGKNIKKLNEKKSISSLNTILIIYVNSHTKMYKDLIALISKDVQERHSILE